MLTATCALLWSSAQLHRRINSAYSIWRRVRLKGDDPVKQRIASALMLCSVYTATTWADQEGVLAYICKTGSQPSLPLNSFQFIKLMRRNALSAFSQSFSPTRAELRLF